MDIIVPLCLGLMVALNMLGIISGGGNLVDFADPVSVIITGGGGTVAVLMGNGLGAFGKIPILLKVIISPPKQSAPEMIITLISFADKARREGLLVLEDDLNEVKEDFLRKGMQLVVDGADPEMVKKIMSSEIDEMETRHDGMRKIFEDMAALYPAWGMIGTLIGLVLMLRAMGSGGGSSGVASGMAAALITTYYGSILANGIALPLASKLSALHDEEILVKNVMLEGILSIQAGENPRMATEKLLSFLPPPERKLVMEKVGER